MNYSHESGIIYEVVNLHNGGAPQRKKYFAKDGTGVPASPELKSAIDRLKRGPEILWPGTPNQVVYETKIYRYELVGEVTVDAEGSLILESTL